MHNAHLTEEGKLVITPSPDSSERDFDFMIGKHNVHHRKLKSRLAGSDEWIESEGTEEFMPVLEGKGNIDRYFLCLPIQA